MITRSDLDSYAWAKRNAVHNSLSQMSAAATSSVVRRSGRNWLIHQLYITQEHKACLELIEDVLKGSSGGSEYALYVKGLIKRQQGLIHESLALFQQVAVLNPRNISNLKQVGRSLYLLGRHKQAIEVYKEAAALNSEDWEVYHNIGLCYMYLKQYDQAVEEFENAKDVQRQDATYLQLGKVYALQQKYEEAVAVYEEALAFSPQNTDILITLGLLSLRMGNVALAMQHLGNAQTFDPKDPRSILAAGSINQDNNAMDVALNKYRVAAIATPDSPQLWNNIGVCFLGQKRYVAAISCLKRALFLAQFEWIISYNLGIVYLNTGQYASAFHYLSASINLHPHFGSTYMYLAVCLSRLGDENNAFAAYEKALQLDDSDFLFELNYAVTLFNAGHRERASEHFARFNELFRQADEETRNQDPDVLKQKQMLEDALKASAEGSP